MIETAIGALGGSLAAFGLENFRKSREHTRENAHKGNQVLYKLMEHWNTLEQFRRGVINITRDHPVRAIVMERTQRYELDERISVGDLDFLVERGFSQLVFNVIIEDQRFRTAISAINERSSKHAEWIQKPMAAAGVTEGTLLSHKAVRDIVGEYAFVTMTRLTDDIIENVDASVKSILELQPELRAKLLYTCPGKPFIKFGPK